MKKIAFAIVVAWGCSHKPTIFYGMPTPAAAVCGTFKGTGEAICIDEGKAYACVGPTGCDDGPASCVLATPELKADIHQHHMVKDQEDANDETQSLVIMNMSSSSR